MSQLSQILCNLENYKKSDVILTQFEFPLVAGPRPLSGGETKSFEGFSALETLLGRNPLRLVARALTNYFNNP